MTEHKIDSTVIKRTQDTLGKHVKKPPLTEKLLKKPPFRFLFDVFSVVIKETGCFEGLYTSDELNIDNIKDRDDKMRFLQKMIDVVQMTTNQPITVRTSKIVAGQEPEKTNELMQLIGEIIEKQLDWKIAVENINGGALSPTKEKKITKEKAISKDIKREKSKDVKATTKTISPTVKDDKLKVKNSKDKIPVDSKSTKDERRSSDAKSKEKNKSNRKVKDMPESKPKGLKSKTVAKQKTPSPVKGDSQLLQEKTADNKNKATKSQHNESRLINAAAADLSDSKISNEINNDMVEKPAELLKLKPDQNSPHKIKDNGRTTLKENSATAIRKSSVSGEISNEINDTKEETSTESSVQKLNENISKDTNGSPKESSSRKSSATRKTSGKSRHSSASKHRKDENENNQSSINQLESLNTLNEEETAISSIPNKTSAAATGMVEQKRTTDVKRESTFTRENSKEAVSNRPRTSLRPPSARPASARPGAPRRRDKNVEIILQPNDQVKMSGINVKLETFGDLDDDGENLVIIENTNVDEVLDMHARMGNAIDVEESLEQQGHLVQQILETQKELAHQNTDMLEKSEKDSELTNNTLNNRKSSARQMDNLRDVIQNLTKSVNPFGKLMDFIPEDIDAMQLELSMWRDSYTQSASELKKERSLTESATEPMKNQLIQIEASLKEYQDMIAASRTKILQNSEKIIKMLSDQ